MIPVRIPVQNPDELLTTGAFGAGALVQVQSSATGGGAGYSTIGTVALVATQTEYLYYDTTGATSAWYRTRYANAALSNFSDFSPEFQVAAVPPLLSVEQFREHVNASATPDSAIRRLLDANTLSITERNGPVGTYTPPPFYPHGSKFIYLGRPAASITSITEFYFDPIGISGVSLDSTDYRLQNNGRELERWGYGTHPAAYWSHRVEMTYVPVDDSAERIRVLIKLVELDLNRQPGLSMTRIGEYMEQSRNEPYNDEREAILASLVPSGLMFA